MESTSPVGAIIPHGLGIEYGNKRTWTFGIIESMEWSSRQ